MLYLGLLVVGIVVAWQVNLLLSRRRAGALPGPVRPALRMRAPSRQTGPMSSPKDFVGGAFAAEGVSSVNGDPAGIIPPASAERLSTFRLGDGSLVGRYDWPGEVAAAAEHYAQTLAAAGYRRLSDAPDAGGRRMLVLTRGQTKVIITLRKGARNGKIVRIVVTVMDPPGSDAEPK